MREPGFTARRLSPPRDLKALQTPPTPLSPWLSETSLCGLIQLLTLVRHVPMSGPLNMLFPLPETPPLPLPPPVPSGLV